MKGPFNWSYNNSFHREEMEKNEIRNLIATKIVGQGCQVDVGSTLPHILNAILDLFDENSGVVLEVSENTTVNSQSVPKLTDEQILSAYNCVLAAKPCAVTDADAVNHFMVLGGEMADDVASIQLLFSDEMVLTYTEGGTITYKEL